MPLFPQQGPAPRIPGRVLGWDGWKREFLPFFFPPSPLVLAESFQPGGQLPDELQLRVIHLFGAILSGSKVFLGWGRGQRGHGGVPTALPNPHCPPYGVGYIGTGWGEGNQDPAPSLSCSKQGIEPELNSLTSKNLLGSRLEITAWVTPSIHPKKKTKMRVKIKSSPGRSAPGRIRAPWVDNSVPSTRGL